MLKHEEQDCDICLAEEQKSPESDFKINRTKILDKLIIPKNECCICKLKFQSINEQMVHFSQCHECELCGFGFRNADAIAKHENENHCLYCKKYFRYEIQTFDHQKDCDMKPTKFDKFLRVCKGKK